jgi:hypothetical protein
MIARSPQLLFRLLAMAAFLGGVFSGLAADGGEMRIVARLVWGTNDPKSPNTNHTEVAPELAKKLQKTFKWKNYFLVNSQKTHVPVGIMKPVRMSERCVVEVKNLGEGRVEVKLLGDGKLFGKCTNPLPEDDYLILGGDAENNTAWFVVLRALPVEKPATQKPDKTPKTDPAKPLKEESKQGAHVPRLLEIPSAECVMKEAPDRGAL